MDMQDGMTITTNYHLRDVIHGHELTEAEQKEHDTYAWPDPDEWVKRDFPNTWHVPGTDQVLEVGWNKEFVRYKNRVLDVHDFLLTNIPGWDGYLSECAFWGFLIMYARPCNCMYPTFHGDRCPETNNMDTEHVIIASYLKKERMS